MQAQMTNDLYCPAELDLMNLEEIVVWDPTNWVDLIIRRSDDPQLIISGDEGMLRRYRCSRRGNTLTIKLGGDLFERIADALTTSLSRKRIQIEVAVASLDQVKATGMVEIDLPGWRGEEPEVRLFGPAALWGGRVPFVRP